MRRTRPRRGPRAAARLPAHSQVYGRRRPKFFVAAGFLEALQHQTVPHDGVEGSGVYVREVQRPSHHTPPAAAAA